MKVPGLMLFILSSFCFYPQAGIFAPSKHDVPGKPLLRAQFSFREFKNPDAYRQAVKMALTYAQNSKAPLKIKNCLYFNPSIHFKEADTLLKEKKLELESLKYYIDSSDCEISETGRETLYKNLTIYSRLPYEAIYRPFFIRNSEVTNGEYAEFVSYVIDSIARTLISESQAKGARDYYFVNDKKEKILKYDKDVDWYLYSDVLAPLYLRPSERYYSRKQIDLRKIKFEYTLRDNTYRAIPIYPDTLRWIEDFNGKPADCFEPQCNMYYWHPAFKDHPVVGLTWPQVKAFLYWKTKKLQRELDAKKIPYIVEFDLPTEIELEMIGVLRSFEKKKVKDQGHKADKFVYDGNGDYDLILKKNFNQFQARKNSVSRDGANDLLLNACDRVARYSFMSYPMLPYKLPKKKLKDSRKDYLSMQEKDELKYLNSNASEWMKESLYSSDRFAENVEGKPVSKDRQFALYDSLFPVQGNLENYYQLMEKMSDRKDYNSFQNISHIFNPPGKIGHAPCKLIRGGNWFDAVDADSKILRRNFSQVDSAYSTVGFRYVVRFRHK